MCVKYNNSRVLHSGVYYKVSGVLHHSKQTSGTMNMKRVVSKLDCWLDGRVENASCCPVVCREGRGTTQSPAPNLNGVKKIPSLCDSCQQSTESVRDVSREVASTGALCVCLYLWAPCFRGIFIFTLISDRFFTFWTQKWSWHFNCVPVFPTEGISDNLVYELCPEEWRIHTDYLE